MTDTVVSVELAPLAFVHPSDESISVVSSWDFATTRRKGCFEVEVLRGGHFRRGAVAAIQRDVVREEGPGEGFGSIFCVGIFGR